MDNINLSNQNMGGNDLTPEEQGNFLGQVPPDFQLNNDDDNSLYSEEDATPSSNVRTNNPSIFSGMRRKTLPNIRIKGRKSSDVNRDTSLFEWFIEFQNQHQRAPTRKEAAKKALELSKDQEFKASKGWLDKFSRKFDVEFTPLKIFPSRVKKHRLPGEEGSGSAYSDSFETSSYQSGQSPRVNGQYEDQCSPSSFARRQQEILAQQQQQQDQITQLEEGMDPQQRQSFQQLSNMLNRIEIANNSGTNSPQNSNNPQNQQPTFDQQNGQSQQPNPLQQMWQSNQDSQTFDFKQQNNQFHQTHSYFGNNYNQSSHPYNTHLNPSQFAQNKTQQNVGNNNQQMFPNQQNPSQFQQGNNNTFNNNGNNPNLQQNQQFYQQNQQQQQFNQQQFQQQQNNYNQQQQFNNANNIKQDDEILNKMGNQQNQQQVSGGGGGSDFEVGNYINFNDPGSQQRLSMTDVNQKDFFLPSNNSLGGLSLTNLDNANNGPFDQNQAWSNNGTTFEQMMNQQYQQYNNQN